MFGRIVLKSLFRTLNENIDENGTTYKPITTFNHISISVPQMVKDIGSYDLLGHPSAQDDSVDLRYAINLNDLAWKGDITLLFRKFRDVSWVNITALDISSCTLSVDDAVALIHKCGFLVKASLATLESNEVLDEPNILKKSDMPVLRLQYLRSLTLISNTSIQPLIDRVSWDHVDDFYLTLLKDGCRDAISILHNLESFTKLDLTSSLTATHRILLFQEFPNISYTHITAN